MRITEIEKKTERSEEKNKREKQDGEGMEQENYIRRVIRMKYDI